MIKTTFIICLISSFCFGQDATFLSKDQKSPYDGILMPESKVQELRNNTIQRNEYKLLNESLNRSIDLYKQNESLQDQKFNIISVQNDNLSKSLMEARSGNEWKNILYFGLGVVATGLAVYGAGHLIK